MKASVILNCAGRVEEARYGVASWMAQKCRFDYEVILNLFGKEREMFLGILDDPPPQFRVFYDRTCRFFNISSANNLGAVRATGDLYVFANSDMVYAPEFLETLVAEFSRSQLHYAICNRVNLTKEETAALPAPEALVRGDFAAFRGFENTPKRWQFAISPWVVRKEAFWEIGGFDNAVLCHEDGDLTDRLLHYLRRTGLQGSHHVLSNLHGYHLDHPGSSVFDASSHARKILIPRAARLAADPESTEDVIFNGLDEAALLEVTCDHMPQLELVRNRLRKIPILQRLKKAIAAFKAA